MFLPSLLSDVTNSRSRQTTVFHPHARHSFIRRYHLRAFFFSDCVSAISTRRVNLPKKSNYLLKSRSIYTFFLPPKFVYYIIIIFVRFFPPTSKQRGVFFSLFILPNNYVITWKERIMNETKKCIFIYIFYK